MDARSAKSTTGCRSPPVAPGRRRGRGLARARAATSRPTAAVKFVRDLTLPPACETDPGDRDLRLGDDELDGEALSAIVAEALGLPAPAGTLFFSLPAAPQLALLHGGARSRRARRLDRLDDDRRRDRPARPRQHAEAGARPRLQPGAARAAPGRRRRARLRGSPSSRSANASPTACSSAARNLRPRRLRDRLHGPHLAAAGARSRRPLSDCSGSAARPLRPARARPRPSSGSDSGGSSPPRSVPAISSSGACPRG